MNFLRKYAPKKSSDFLNLDAVNKLKKFLDSGEKACVIYGGNGVGKSESVYVLASELDLEVLEINASDCRNAEKIEKIVGNASKQGSLFKKGKLIFVDEVDGLSGVKDRGALASLIKIIEKSSFPIVFSCNEITEKLEPLKKKSNLVEFPNLDNSKVMLLLEKICKEEGINYDIKDLRKFVMLHEGDLRKVLLNFEGLVDKSGFVLDNSIVFPENKEEMDNFLVKLFRVKNLKTSLEASDELNNDFFNFSKGRSPVIFSGDDCVCYWIEENLPLEYKRLEESFDLLSKADVFLGRIRRQQHWRFFVYGKALNLGVNVVDKGDGKVKFKKTRRSPKQNFRLWRLVSKKKKMVAEKIALKNHLSVSKAMKDVLPYFKLISFDKKSLMEEFDFSKEEVEWLNNHRP